MSSIPLHITWLVNTNQKLKTADGKDVIVFEFKSQNDEAILSEWAKHFRNHYCLDSEIDSLVQGTGFTRAQYLNQIKFPDATNAPGPSIRAGDFAEILIADYLEYLLGYWVPRTRYCDKTIRNESTKGSDVIGFRILKDGQESINDTLAVFEIKASFSGTKLINRLQEAVSDSGKDVLRKAVSLNAIKQHLLDKNKIELISRVERFQNPVDHPYKEQLGASALFSRAVFSSDLISKTDTSAHPNKDNLVLIVVFGNDMMKLVHTLYARAANEA